MARAAIAVGVGCVVVCAGWWMFAQGAAGPSLAPDPALAASSQMPSPATGPVPAAVAPPVPEAAAIERTSAPEPEPGSQPPIPADAKWADVLVVDKQTDKPVADAEACWSDETQMLLVAKLPPLARDAAYRDLERVAKQFGWHGRSDRDGRLRVNLGKNGTQVFARAGSRYGEARLNAQTEDPKERQRILLEEDETVRVRVLDAVGRPAAGVPVSLDPFDATRKGRTSFGGEPYTDAEGTALFAHVQARRSWGDKRELATQFAIRICIGGFPIEPVLIDAQPPPIEPVEVRLPPTGRLRAKVTFEDKPLPGLDALTVHAGREKGETYGDDYKAPLAPDGWAHFGYVPVGKMLYVGSGHATGAWDLEVQGPTVLDQEVTASFELAGEVIALTGRLLEVDGSPVANQQVQGDITSTLIGGGVFMQTDEAGHFVCTLGRHRPEWKRELKLSKLAFERRPADAPAQRVEVPARDLVVGRNDLGDLRFSVAALVVAGRFVFDTPGSSRPWFQVQRFWTSQGRAGPVEHWDAMDGLQMDSREDGTFEVRGTLAADRYRLSVMAQDLLPADPVEFALGAKDLTIAVRRGARLTVTCVLPEGLDPQRVVLRLHVAGAVAVAPKSANAMDRFRMREDPLLGKSWERNAEKAKYQWPALEPATYALLVEVPGFPESLLTIADVVVPQPEGGDPRLSSLDLREAIGTLRLRANAPGNERRSILVFPQPQPADSDWNGIPAAAGETVIAVPKRPVDLLIAADGMRPSTLRGAVGTADLTLEPWPTVEVHFLGLETLPAGATLRAGSRVPGKPPRDGPRYVSEWASGQLDSLLNPPQRAQEVKNGIATLAVGDGPMDLFVYVSIEARGRVESLKQLTPNQIVAGAPVTVQLAADELRTVIENLQKAVPPKK